MSANAYDAAGLLLQAVAEVGEDREEIRDYLISIDSPEEAYEGVTGKTYFNEQGDSQKSAYVKMVKDEEFVPAPKQMN
jgi:branched-chain amino acid transport system substrate-binding protein